jgi:hypothetical protein
MNRQKLVESGQIMVLFVISIIALFGIAALAIDGGRLYFERRAAQGASDDAAMTGALAILQGYIRPEVESIVLNRAMVNGFDNAVDDVQVDVHWPPIAPNPYAGDRDFIQVFITSEIPPVLSQFVFIGSLQVTVEAIAHVQPTGPIIPGYAIYGTNPGACRTVEFSGNPIVKVWGGGSIGSNSDAECPCGSMVSGGNVSVEVFDGGEITASGCWNNLGTAGDTIPEPVTYVEQLNLDKIRESVPIPDCGSLDSVPDYGDVTFNSVGTLSPGYYKSMKFTADADVTLLPGLYCIYGKDPWTIETKGGARIQGEGIMIYLMSTSGSWKSAGNAYISLTAPTDLVDASGNQWAGMLIYTHPDNSNEVVLTGTSDSYYEGSVYSLASHCFVEGTTGGVTFNTQVFCDTVDLGGTGDLRVYYEEGNNYQVPAAVELSK